MNRAEYKPRVIDETVEKYLRTFGAVCLEGPKWCGKTWTSAEHAASEFYVGDPAGNFQNRQLAEMDPSLVLDGEAPRLIDEWQEVPALWDAVRFEIDKSGAKGRFLLTGSSTPKRKGILHSGTGRIARLRMRPMSLYEMGYSSGRVSLEALCNGKLSPCVTEDVSLKLLAELVVRGGWPESLGLALNDAISIPKEYIKAVIENDIDRIDDKKRNKHKFELLLRSLARNEATVASNNTLKNDIKAEDAEDIDIDTVAEYLDVLSRLFLIENQPPFAANVRSRTRIKQKEKRHFCDPSLACALMKLTPDMLINDLNTFGFQFEAMDFSYLTLIFLLFLVFYRIVTIDEHILIHYFEPQSIFYSSSLPSAFLCSRLPSRAPHDMGSSCLFRLFWACTVFDTPFVSMPMTLWRRTGQVL